jgi:hypothetical protein
LGSKSGTGVSALARATQSRMKTATSVRLNHGIACAKGEYCSRAKVTHGPGKGGSATHRRRPVGYRDIPRRARFGARGTCGNTRLQSRLQRWRPVTRVSRVCGIAGIAQGQRFTIRASAPAGGEWPPDPPPRAVDRGNAHRRTFLRRSPAFPGDARSLAAELAESGGR